MFTNFSNFFCVSNLQSKLAFLCVFYSFMFINQLIVTVGLLDMDRLLLEVFSICFTILPLQSIGTSAKQNEGEIVDILFANATRASLNFRVLLTTILQP